MSDYEPDKYNITYTKGYEYGCHGHHHQLYEHKLYSYDYLWIIYIIDFHRAYCLAYYI